MINPDLNYPDEKKRKAMELQRKGGNVTISNVKWTYDFRPIKNFAIIFLCMAVAITIYFYTQRTKQVEITQENIEKEAEEVQRRYYERVLEKLKNETIAAERLKAERRGK